MVIEHIHKAKEAEIRANLERPLPEDQMVPFIMKNYKKVYPNDKTADFLIASTSNNKKVFDDEIEELYGPLSIVLDLS